MFEKNLQDLVKGIRATKGDVNVYISQSLQEIKSELKSTDPFVKAQAVRKLTYLHMLGYDMCWAAFHVVEVMSFERFAHKRIGYTAASQSFTQATDVVLLCTNLLKKEFGSASEYEVGLAINVLANIVTTDLARDLLGDVVAMMGAPRAYVRKKATLVLYKMFLRYPPGLRLTFERLKERMEEPDVAVVSCAVNVICELATKKPKNYLGLAPQFFRLLTTSSNNWMLIKVVKLLASLVPEEPRLARKLLDPLATVIQNTPAKSLLYECISTVTTALLYTAKSDGSQPRNVAAIVRLCNDHLRRYIEDPDQNLRYLGLVGLSNLMQSHPHVIAEHQALIVECLAVDDITIRMRSLELLAGMVTPENAAPIIRELMRQTLSADGAYRHELIARILHVCSVNKYENIHDFDWYIHVLVQLARVPGISTTAAEAAATADSNCGGATATTAMTATTPAVGSYEYTRTRSHGVEVARQLLDIAVRVKSVRSVMVANMVELLMEKDALSGPGASTLSEVLYAAAWIAGEYVLEYLEDVDDEDEDEDDDDDDERDSEEEKLARVEDLVDEMLQPRTTALPAHVQTVYIQALLKLLTATAEKADDDAVEKLAELILERLPAFVQSEHVEVQERAVALQQILLALGLGLGALSAEERASRAFDSSSPSLTAASRLDILNSYFAERLAPVGAKAQRKVPLPAGLDLDEPLSALEASFLESGGDVSGFTNEDDLEVSFVHQGHSGNSSSGGGGYTMFDDHSPHQPQKSKHRASRNGSGSRRRSKGGSSSGSDSSGAESGDSKAELERQYALEKERLRKDPFYLSGSGASGNGGTDHSKSKKTRAILEDELMPDGARSSDDDRRRGKKKPSAALDEDNDLSAIDLSVPLGENEKIPDEHLYHRQPKPEAATARSSDRKSKAASSSSRKKQPSSSAKEERKASKSKSTKHRRHHDDAGDNDNDSAGDSKRKAKSRHSSRPNESKENVYGNASSAEEEDDEANARRHHSKSKSKSSSHSKSSKHRRDGEKEAEGGKKSRSSSKRQEDGGARDKAAARAKKDKSKGDKPAPAQQDELLLLF
ncbi:hypothetical protein PybrP1_005937 [[Pythium] brassicae (nom. inval.)]|nr:hypothetical protein PybrP1_005937 [[Pythium] brassicae (nom. inval.)]